MGYKPLPKCVYIKRSDIHGMGLFAKKDLKVGKVLGVAHIKIPHSEFMFPQGFCRTPLGGFYNHSDNPNCTLQKDLIYFTHSSSNVRLTTIVLKLVTIRKIKKDEELTCKYTLYELDDILK